MDDFAIVELFLSRDESALVSVARKYGPRLLNIAFGIVRDHQTAEEIVNDAYLSVWELIPPNEPREYLFEFMARIVRHKAIDRLRRERARKRSAELVELTREMEECIPSRGGVEDELEAKELRARINGFLCSLPPEKCDVFLRRYWFADSIGDIAKRFHKTRGSVRSMLWRMRNELRDYLGITEGDPNERQ